MACFMLYDYEDSLKSSDLVFEDEPCLFNMLNVEDNPEVEFDFEDVEVEEVEARVEDVSMMKVEMSDQSQFVVPDSLGDVDTFVPETCPKFLEFDARMKELDREANRRILVAEERRKRVMVMRETLEHRRWFIEEISKYFPAFKILLEDLGSADGCSTHKEGKI